MADALNVHARAFQQQENLVGELCGIAKSRLAAQINDMVAQMRLVCLDDGMRGVFFLGQLDGDAAGRGAAPLPPTPARSTHFSNHLRRRTIEETAGAKNFTQGHGATEKSFSAKCAKAL